MDTVYFYWHPDEAKAKGVKEDRGGFYTPSLTLIAAGWEVKKHTGQYPDPEDLAKRMNTRFKLDIDYFDELIERGRPAPDTILKPEQ